MPAKSMMLSMAAVICRLLRPRMAPLSRMFSRPVSSPWKPAPSSRSAETRPLTSHRAGRRPIDAGQHLEGGGLARAVLADESEGRALGDHEGGVPERPELLGLRRLAADEPFLEARATIPVQQEALGQAVRGDGDVVHMASPTSRPQRR